jgi:hypothetical protein
VNEGCKNEAKEEDGKEGCGKEGRVEEVSAAAKEGERGQ